MKAIALTLLLMIGPSVYASLGGSVDSISADSQILRAKSIRIVDRTVAHAAFTIHEISSGATIVREYVNASGIVFAIAWNGMSHPDLSALLGTYYADYQTEIRSQSHHVKGSRFGRITAANHLVVERGGHMRNVRGRAYDLTLFPPGVTLQDIQ